MRGFLPVQVGYLAVSRLAVCCELEEGAVIYLRATQGFDLFCCNGVSLPRIEAI